MRTYSNLSAKSLTIEDIKKLALSIQKIKPPKENKIDWFTRFMNRRGWHREYEIIIIDKEKFNYPFPPPPNNPLIF